MSKSLHWAPYTFSTQRSLDHLDVTVSVSHSYGKGGLGVGTVSLFGSRDSQRGAFGTPPTLPRVLRRGFTYVVLPIPRLYALLKDRNLEESHTEKSRASTRRRRTLQSPPRHCPLGPPTFLWRDRGLRRTSGPSGSGLRKGLSCLHKPPELPFLLRPLVLLPRGTVRLGLP